MLFISNFVLGIFNILGNKMKKSYLVFLVSFLVLISVGVWIYSSGYKLPLSNPLELLVILLIVGFGILIGVRRLKSEKRGQPAEDELSKKIMQKAASFSYFISIYLLLFLMYISDKINQPTHTVLGMGILGMAVIFAVCWVVISMTGIKNE